MHCEIGRGVGDGCGSCYPMGGGPRPNKNVIKTDLSLEDCFGVSRSLLLRNELYRVTRKEMIC